MEARVGFLSAARTLAAVEVWAKLKVVTVTKKSAVELLQFVTV
jgi:hypothetical protein